MAKKKKDQEELDEKRASRIFRTFRNLPDHRKIAFLSVAIQDAASTGASADAATIAVIRRQGKTNLKICMELTLPKKFNREWQKEVDRVYGW
jgi:hypothetical protein